MSNLSYSAQKWQFWTILCSYKLCTQVEIFYLLKVLLTIPLNKSPWSLGNSEKNRYSQNGQKSIALDVYYLSMADFIVCTFSSNVCRLAYALRLLKIIKFINELMISYFFPFCTVLDFISKYFIKIPSKLLKLSQMVLHIFDPTYSE